MTTTMLDINPMSRNDLNVVIDWAAAEGWNPGLQDANSFYNTDPGGFLVGKLDGEIIGSISVVKYGDDFGFLGFYIVHPDYRGKGYGLKIWNAGMDYLKGRNIGLDGVVDQQANYKISGFEFAYNNIRFEDLSESIRTAHPSVVPLSTLDLNKVLGYDKKFFPANRATFLTSWINQAGSEALAYLDNGKISGYGVIRPCRSGYKVGPVFADDGEKARAIYDALKATAEPNQPIYLDVPEPNADAVVLAKEYDMQKVFETARMYTKNIPDIPLKQIFGVTTFELG